MSFSVFSCHFSVNYLSKSSDGVCQKKAEPIVVYAVVEVVVVVVRGSVGLEGNLSYVFLLQFITSHISLKLRYRNRLSSYLVVNFHILFNAIIIHLEFTTANHLIGEK